MADLRTVMSLEDFEFHAGIRRCQQSAQGFAGSLSGGLGRSVGQVGFALQDFSSILSMGGKNALPRALMSTMNNVQMLGGVFGQTGLAVTSIAGALASILIPKLMETEKASEDVSTAIKEQIATIDKLSSKYGEMLNFSHKISGIGTSAGAENAIGDVERHDKQLKFRQERLEALGKQIGGDLIGSGKAVLAPGLENDTTGAKLRALQAAKEGGNKDLPELAEAKKLGEELLEIEIKRRDLAIERAAAAKKHDELKDQEEFQGALDATMKKQKKQREEEDREEREFRKQEEHRAHEIEGLRKQNLSPGEKFLEDLSHLEDLDLDEELFGRASDKLLEQYDAATKKGLGPDQVNRAFSADTAQAYEEFRASVREQERAGKDPRGEERDILKDMLGVARKQLKAAEDNGVVPVQI